MRAVLGVFAVYAIASFVSAPALAQSSDTYRQALAKAATSLASALRQKGYGEGDSLGFARFRDRNADVVCEPMSSLLAEGLRQAFMRVNSSFNLGFDVASSVDPRSVPVLGGGRWHVGTSGTIVLKLIVGDTLRNTFSTLAMEDAIFSAQSLPREARSCLLSFKDVEKKVTVAETLKVRSAPSSLAPEIVRVEKGQELWISAQVTSSGKEDWYVVDLPEDDRLPIGLRNQRGFVLTRFEAEPRARLSSGNGGTQSVDEQVFRDCPICPALIKLPPGTVVVKSRQKPAGVRVRIGYTHAIGKYEVSVREMNACVQEGGCDSDLLLDDKERLDHPAVNVSWLDAKKYVDWLSVKTGKLYRLPSEAEWEYAARGGTKTTYWWGDTIGRGNAVCVKCGTAQGGRDTAPVASLGANPFGLHHVHGNVWEWVEDCFKEGYVFLPTDGSPFTNDYCDQKVRRGGSWRTEPGFAKSNYRSHYSKELRASDTGFRIVREVGSR